MALPVTFLRRRYEEIIFAWAKKGFITPFTFTMDLTINKKIS